MTIVERLLIELLKSAISGKQIDFLAYENLSLEKWREAYKLAAQHGLSGVTFTAIENLPKGYLADVDLLMDWMWQKDYVVSKNEQYHRDVCAFLSTLRQNGLIPIILKGLDCARRYPNPNRRPSGDLDIFLLHPELSHPEAFEKGNTLVRQLGISIEPHDYKHVKFTYKNVVVENHMYCTEIRGSKAKKKFEIHLQELLRTSVDAGNGCYYYPNSQFTALFLIAHSFNHFLDEELALKHICDWAAFLKKEQDNVDWDDFYHYTDKVNITRFANTLTSLVVEYLGISLNNSHIRVESQYAFRMLDDTFHNNSHLHSSGLHGYRYRLMQMRNHFASSWKYRDICRQNPLLAYIKTVIDFCLERNPTIYS